MQVKYILLVISLAILSNGCSSKLIPASNKKWNKGEVLKRTNDNTVVFIDNEKKGGMEMMKTIKSTEIARINAYFNDDKKVPRIFKPYLEKGVISVTTKSYAISQYRPLLSEISADTWKRQKTNP